jgi:hypothetical protein
MPDFRRRFAVTRRQSRRFRRQPASGDGIGIKPAAGSGMPIAGFA